METFSALLAICAGNSPVPGEFPTQRPVTRSFDVYFDKTSHRKVYPIALKSDRYLGYTTAGVPVKFQNDTLIRTSISRLRDFAIS